MRGVWNLRALAQLARVVTGGEVQRRVEARGQQRRVGELLDTA
jgi:hypothetical protein